MRSLVAVALAVAVISGCAVGPDYQPPQMSMPAQYNLSPSSQPAATQPAEAAGQPAAPPDLATWWRVLGDPTLDALIDRAVESNLDLIIATARVREARALRDVAVAAFFPQVGANSAYSYRGSSLNTSPRQQTGGSRLQSLLPSLRLRQGEFNPATGTFGAPLLTVNGVGLTGDPASQANVLAGVLGRVGEAVTGRIGEDSASVRRDQNLFSAGFDASWEIDVFGRIRRSVEAAEAEWAAAEEARRAVLVSLVSEVALNYVQLRGTQRRLEIAEQNIRVQQDTLELTLQRAEVGFIGELDVAQARAQLETTRSAVPLLASSIRQSLYQLSVLLGQTPETLLEELDRAAPIPATPPEVPIGLPSDLLQCRPDIRQAERVLAAATARIGVATADLFPRFLINGAFGTQTADIQHFFDENSLFWSIGPAMQWSIFEGGRTLASIEAERARTEQALAGYRLTVLIALQEVENALVAYNNEKVRYDTLVAAVEANQKATDISKELYPRFTAFLNVLDAERSLYASQDQLVQSETATVTSLIALYKALGGGWDASAPPESQPAEECSAAG